VTSNLNKVRNSGLQNLLYVNFIVKKKYRVDEVSKIMGYHKDTVYRWIRGERPFPVDEIPNLVKSTGDIEYLEYLADLCDFSIMPKIKDKTTAKMLFQMTKIFQSAIDLEEHK